MDANTERYTFDGFGINDAHDQYKARIATFTKYGLACVPSAQDLVDRLNMHDIVTDGRIWLEKLGALVGAAHQRDMSRDDQNSAIESAHSELFIEIRSLEKQREGLAPALRDLIKVAEYHADDDAVLSAALDIARAALAKVPK